MTSRPHPKTATAPARKKSTGLRVSRGFLQPAIETMARVHSEKGSCIFAFTAPNRRAGTSYVVNLLAEELLAQFDATVAIIPTEAMKGCDPNRLPQGFTEQAPKLWTAVPDETLQHMPDFALENVWISPGAHSFDFILVDCPALTSNPVALRWAADVDGVIAVIQAGVTRIDQIQATQRLLESSATKLAGMVLNRRTYPIPNFLFKLL